MAKNKRKKEPLLTVERLLYSQGFGSRHECRALSLQGRVSVDGTRQVDPDAELSFFEEGMYFTVDEQSWPYQPQAYIALNKPADYECSQKPSTYPSVYTLLPAQLRTRGVQAAGRLDADTTGLLLFSDDGQFIHKAISGKRETPKVYRITTKHEITSKLIEKLLTGVKLDDEPEPITAAACEQQDTNTLMLTITTGKYHQVKRMIAAAGNRVEALHRETVGKLTLPDTLKIGEWMWVTPEQVL